MALTPDPFKSSNFLRRSPFYADPRVGAEVLRYAGPKYSRASERLIARTEGGLVPLPMPLGTHSLEDWDYLQCSILPERFVMLGALAVQLEQLVGRSPLPPPLVGLLQRLGSERDFAIKLALASAWTKPELEMAFEHNLAIIAAVTRADPYFVTNDWSEPLLNSARQLPRGRVRRDAPKFIAVFFENEQPLPAGLLPDSWDPLAVAVNEEIESYSQQGLSAAMSGQPDSPTEMLDAALGRAFPMVSGTLFSVDRVSGKARDGFLFLSLTMVGDETSRHFRPLIGFEADTTALQPFFENTITAVRRMEAAEPTEVPRVLETLPELTQSGPPLPEGPN